MIKEIKEKENKINDIKKNIQNLEHQGWLTVLFYDKLYLKFIKALFCTRKISHWYIVQLLKHVTYWIIPPRDD